MRDIFPFMKMVFAVVMMTVAVGVLSVPPLTFAQKPGKIYRIGWLENEEKTFLQAFLEQFRELGWVEGKNFVMEYQTAPFKEYRKRAPALAAELVRRNVDIIVAGGTPGCTSAKAATDTIPIVMSGCSRPDRLGFIKSFAEPGGNITGLTTHPAGFHSKIIEVLQKILPRMSRLGVLLNPVRNQSINIKERTHRWQTLVEPLGLTAIVVKVEDASQYPEAFNILTREKVDAMYVNAGNLNIAHKKLITDYSLKHRIPITSSSNYILFSGGLMRYWTDWLDLRRLSAFYVDKILKGANPGGIPVQRPRKFELKINLKTAKKLGITIPPVILMQATHVIQ